MDSVRGPIALLAVAALVVSAVLLGACSANTATPVPGSMSATGATAGPATTGAPAPADCRQRIEAARLDDAASLDAVDACRFTVKGRDGARDALGAGGSDDVTWAAIWVYATLADDPAPLRPILDRSSPTLRVMAAAGLVALGDRTGFDVLAAATGDSSILSASHPSITIREFVVGTLFRYIEATGAPGRPTSPEERASAPARWTDWLNQHEGALTFNAETATWTAP